MKKLVLTFALAFALFTMVSCGTDTTTEVTTAAATTVSDASITVYTRDTTSGTREAFFKGIDFDAAVEDNSELVSGYVEVSSNGTMVSSINNDEYGIGYISLSSLDESGLNGLDFEGVQATEANVLNDTYGLKRPFNYMIREDWTGLENAEIRQQIVEAFVAYMGTVDGKATIADHAGILLSSATDSTWDDIKGNYDVCTYNNENVTVYFGGSTSVESIARALSAEFSAKCGNFIYDHNHTGSGDAYKRVQGSEADGSSALDIGFASRAFKLDDTEPGAAGTYGQICWDAVVVVTNSANTSITNLTAEDIKKIYNGTFTLWNQLG